MRKAILYFIIILLCTYNSNAQWEYIGFGVEGGAGKFLKVNNYIFAGTWNKGIIRSDDKQFQWNYYNKGLKVLYINDIKNINNSLFLALDYGGIFFSSNFGESWEESDSGLEDDIDVSSLLVIGKNLLASTKSQLSKYKGVYKSNNNGKSWVKVLQTNKPIIWLRNYGLKVVAIANVSVPYCFKSQDGGLTFDSTQGKGYTSDPNIYFDGVFHQGELYLTSTDGIFRSSDMGDNYIKLKGTGLPLDSNNKILPLSIRSYDDYLFLSFYKKGMYISKNNGDTWFPANIGFQEGHFGGTIYILEDYIYSGTDIGIYRAKISDLISYINKIKESEQIEVKDAYLYHSKTFPNPAGDFVRNTIFWNSKYDINKAQIDIYDIYGVKIEEPNLKIELQNDYSANIGWECSLVPSGVYFMKVSIGSEFLAIPFLVNR